ncbi:hypothetical protein SteCoe_624 [Stentor coeruleus]|uniref:Uncharacterized protein n=1 Tax=Stentor coeruleus TaxID=5963 RepID=A0A1R2D3Q9_9CILI|nr:hypothetical protein SteCoe_624 [Stentor coeruleus]
MEEGKNYSDEEGENEDIIPEDPDVLGHNLIKSSANGDLKEVQSLLKRKADPNFTDKKSWTPLMWASSQGHTEIVKLLLDKNGKVIMNDSMEKASNNHTPLHWSSFNGHLHVVWVLIKQGLDPNDIDKFGNNCVHHAVAGGRKDILETLLALGVHTDHKNSRGHMPSHLTSDEAIKDMIQGAYKAKKCKKCLSVFDIRNTKHLCQVCKKYYCTNCKILSWVFINYDSVEEERPVLRCLDCQTLVDQAEYQLQEAIDSNSYTKLSTLIEKVVNENINVDVKILYKARREVERLKAEIDINAFIGTLQYVENYKTIQKSVHVLSQMLDDCTKIGIKIDQKIIDKIHKETKRLLSERNLRHQISIISLSDGCPELVKTIEELIKIAEENEVSLNYITKAREITEKMREVIDSHAILRKFLDYPIREYPDLTPIDPKKKPNPAEEAKKRKKEPKIQIPSWAEELPALIKQVDALEQILKKSQKLEIPNTFIDQAKENIARMKKEIKYRQMEEEEARLAAEKKQSDKNKKK